MISANHNAVWPSRLCPSWATHTTHHTYSAELDMYSVWQKRAMRWQYAAMQQYIHYYRIRVLPPTTSIIRINNNNTKNKYHHLWHVIMLFCAVAYCAMLLRRAPRLDWPSVEVRVECQSLMYTLRRTDRMRRRLDSLRTATTISLLIVVFLRFTYLFIHRNNKYK